MASSSLNTVTVDGVTYDYDQYMAKMNANKTANSDYISKDTFLTLLVKQMQYQDPLDPMDNGEYLSQSAHRCCSQRGSWFLSASKYLHPDP